MNKLTHLSLFSGIGGLDIAAEWAGFQTVGQCEWADYPYQVLKKHWPDVPKWRNVRDLTADDFDRRIGGGITVLSGGFPCQPFSVAGNQRGALDDRYLWPEMLRVIREIRPLWVVAENVPGIINIAAEAVCEGLEQEGYAVRAYVYEAAAVGAPHRRSRVVFVANSNRAGREEHHISSESDGEGHDTRRDYETLGNANGGGWRGNLRRWSGSKSKDGHSQPSGRTIEPGMGGIPDGISCELDSHRWPALYGQAQHSWEPPLTAGGVKYRAKRVKALGNAVVPQQFYPIFKAIVEMEEGIHETDNFQHRDG